MKQQDPVGTQRPVGRPSVRGERQTQIYEAVEACLFELGFAATTLEAIAERAGVKRSAIAYFVGNRDDVIDAGVIRSVKRFQDSMIESVSDSRREDQLGLFVEILLRPDAERYRIITIADEVIAHAHRNSHAREQIKGAFINLERFVLGMVQASYPNAPLDTQEATATALILLLRDLDRVQSLGATGNLAKQRKHVGQVIDALMAAIEAA